MPCHSRDDGEGDVFVHQTAIIRNNPDKIDRSVGEDEQVEFIIIQGAKVCSHASSASQPSPLSWSYWRSSHSRGEGGGVEGLMVVVTF